MTTSHNASSIHASGDGAPASHDAASHDVAAPETHPSDALPYEGSGLDIAVIGMGGRFPGAETVDAFWHNLVGGVESISTFTEDELRESGIPESMWRDPNYVPRRPLMDDVDGFDARFFGFSPREAELMDPQQRHFLECAWEALEHAGYGRRTADRAVGVFAGVSASRYLTENLLTNPDHLEAMGPFQVGLLNDKDFISTHASYKLGLTGPGVTVQTACSTSLVAVHLACQSLLDFDSDVALAGGASISGFKKEGYFYAEGSIESPDGYCRAFDADAEGTLKGDGVGIVVLKRLDDALDDGDTIYAVVRASAINNDGLDKVGYTAPSVGGQTHVVTMAQELAQVDPATIGYVEAHGTGTRLGDPIEVEALTRAFRRTTDATGFCGLGSVKTNLGHLDAAAGVTGLMKTVLALHHREIPPSLHFERPNPELDIENSPFFVVADRTPWPVSGSRRRAGVSSFGIGGTNAHAVLEEAPPATPSPSPNRPEQLLLVSAQTKDALDAATDRLADHLDAHPEQSLADVAYTLQVGREPFAYRRSVVATRHADAAQALRERDPDRVAFARDDTTGRAVSFLFPGGGAQYVGMGRDLYEREPVFREHVDRCLAAAQPHLDVDLKSLLYPADGAADAPPLERPSTALPALFAVEYALARLWMHWGVRPAAMIGHSLGEYAAACLAGVFSVEDALRLVVTRGRLFETLPKGSMVSVPLSVDAVRERLPAACSIAAVNAPSLCVAAGPDDAIDGLVQRLADDGVDARRLHIDVAAHSSLVDGIVPDFRACLDSIALHAPQIPYVSNLSGTWAEPDTVATPAYWTRHLRHTVHFSDGVQTLLESDNPLLLEVGPGRTLTSLARQHAVDGTPPVLDTSLRHPKDAVDDVRFAMQALGRLALAGVDVDWDAVHSDARRRRVPLPTYPFQRQSYWIAPSVDADARPRTLGKNPRVDDWFSVPSWTRSVRPPTPSTDDASRPIDDEPGIEEVADAWLFFVDATEDAVGAALAARVQRDADTADVTVVTVRPGNAFAQDDAATYRIRPDAPADYDALLESVRSDGAAIRRIVHAWSLDGPTGHEEGGAATVDDRVIHFEAAQRRGYHSVVTLAQSLAAHGIVGTFTETDPIHLDVLTTGLHDAAPVPRPENATLLGPCLTFPQEFPGLTCRCIDVTPSGDTDADRAGLVEALHGELAALVDEVLVAYRGRQRFTYQYEPVRLDAAPDGPAPFRENGTYLIVGGLGQVGLHLARRMARTASANLVLMSRSGLPPRSTWDALLTDADTSRDVQHRIRAVREIESEGGTVWVATGDVADASDVRTVVAETQRRFGALHGVLHAAAVIDTDSISCLVPDMTRDGSDEQFHAKVRGTYALEDALRDVPVDFCLLFSSNASVLGGIGSTAYAAANHFLDVYAIHRSRSAPWLVANWDGWQVSDDATPVSDAAETSMDAYAMHPAESIDALERVLQHPSAGRVVVSTGDVQARLDQWVRPRSDADAAADVDEGSGAADDTHYGRPDLRTEFVAPDGDTETAVASIWEDLLGIRPVGRHDNFFELGGHSLLATQILARIRTAFSVDLPLRNLFEATTVAKLASLIDALKQTQERATASRPSSSTKREHIEL